MSVNDLIKEGVSLFKSNNFDQAIAKFNQALDEIEDKNSQLEEQNNIQSWLGRCYLEQALKVRDITEAKGLFAQAIEHHQEQLKLAKQLTNEQTSIQKQNNAQHWLGRCYLEQALKVRDITEAKGLFAQAIEHHQEQLKLAKQLTNEQTSIQEQINAQSWLGRCYLEQALKVRDITEAKGLFAQAIEHHQEQLKLAKQLTNEQTSIQKQINAQHWLGRCYFDQALKVRDITEAKGLFAQAIERHQERLELAKQLTDEQTSIQEQNNAQHWLGRCYLEQALKVRDITEAKGLFAQAIEHRREQLKLAKQLTDEQTSIQEQNNAQHWLGRCYLEQALKVRDITEAKGLFAQAIEHHQEQLKLAKQLTDEQTSIQEQNNAQSWLGRCYLEQALKVRDITEAKGLFAQAIEHRREQLKLAKQLTDEQTSIQEQNNAQHWLGRCYLEQALKVRDITEAKGLFTQAIERHQEQLKLAKQLTNEQTSIQEQNNAQHWLGRCYLEQALKVRDITEAKGLFAQAIEHHQEQLKLAKQLTDEQTSIQEQNNAQHWLGRCYLEQALKVRDITEAKGLFAQAIERHQEQLKLAKQLTDEQTSIQEQNNAQHWLGRCYLEQALKVRDITEAKGLFAQAIERHQEQLKLAKQLTNEQTSIQEQNNAQHWLGRCYLEQALKVRDITEAKGLFAQAIERHQEQLKLAKQLTNEQTSIQKQINAQSWLGRCYLEQALKVRDITEAKGLFAQAIEHHQEQLKLAKQLTDEQTSIQEQNNAQHWLGRCYLEQALKVRDITEAKGLFAQAIEHHQEQLKLAKQLTDEQTSIQEQINAQSWLGRCYFEQALKVRDITEAKGLFAQAIERHQEQLKLAKQLTNEQTSIQKQINAQSWLGRCYFEQALKVRDITEAKGLFAQAIERHQERLELAKQLTNEQTSIQEQNNAQSWLGRCYFEQALKVRDITEAKGLFAQAIERHQERLELAKQLTNEQTSIQKQINAQYWLGRCYSSQGIRIKNSSQAKDSSQNEVNDLFKGANGYFLHSLKLLSQFDDEQERYRIENIICYHLRNIFFLRSKWNLYFDKKKQEIRETLFSNKDKGKVLNKKLEGSISTILAVLNIPPIELGLTPLAHYASSSVCNKLFGVVNEDDSSPMRIGSSSYMNDPSEGEGLLELLSLQDLELENKVDCSSHNAFFACFSSRVNDLNQFRLYGKEDGVEASGCCLVFNKNGDWLKVPDISAPFRSFLKNLDENSAEFKETDISNVEYEKLPLYQVAYIAYKDEYIAEEKCEIWLDNFKFGICLKSVDKNSEWHKYRIKKLKEALQQLIKFFKRKANVNDENKNALEYIRYLFKDFAFRDEEEFRVLKMAEIGSEEIEYCKTTKSIYLPYADISNVVDEVILGTNYEKTHIRYKAEVFQHQMKQKCPNVKISRSSLPIYANPPIKKD